MPAPTWKGSTAVHEQAGSPVRTEDSGVVQVVRTYRGPYAAVLAFRPAIGATMDDLSDNDMKVVNSELQPDGAGLQGPATLVVTLSKALDEVIEEIDFGTLEKPVESHPYYSLITPSIWSAFMKWESEPNPVLKGALKYTYTVTYPDYDPATGAALGEPYNQEYVAQLTGIIAELAAKKLRGTTSYVVAAPTLRRTTFSNSKPTPSGIGKRAPAAPFTNAPAGYVWLKMVDRVTYRSNANRWERVEEWVGADFWDVDLYAEDTD